MKLNRSDPFFPSFHLPLFCLRQIASAKVEKNGWNGKQETWARVQEKEGVLDSSVSGFGG